MHSAPQMICAKEFLHFAGFDPKKRSNQKILSRSMLICSVLPLPLNFLSANLPFELLLLPTTLSFCVTAHTGPLVSKCSCVSLYQQERFGVQSLVKMLGTVSKEQMQ